jgi:hypothetical protein
MRFIASELGLNLSLNLSLGLLEVNLSHRIAIGKKPLHRLLQSFSEPVFRLKTKEFFGSADIQAPSRLPVGLGDVPIDLPRKIGLRRNHGGKVANRDFLPCPQVDR